MSCVVAIPPVRPSLMRRPWSGRGLRKQALPMSVVSSPISTSEVLAMPGHGRPVLRIEPSRGGSALRLAELWEFREVLYFIIWRDIKIRYKQTVLGFAWAVVQPAATIVIF